MSDDDSFYDIWSDEDRPVDVGEQQALEIARLRGELEKSKSPHIEKFYIVRGSQIFVCHKSQLKMDKYKDEDSGDVLRNIEVKGARMVMYGEDGVRRKD